MTSFIKSLIIEGENETVDFKNTISNCHKIAKTLVAFANNKGGVLLIGVKDDGSIKGVKDEEEERFMILKAANQYSKPSINITFQEFSVDDKLVLLAKIPESDDKPYFALDEENKWWAYIRIKDKTVLASSIILEVLKNQHIDQEIKYSINEEKLFKYLQTTPQINLKEFTKLTRLSNKKSSKILAKLLIAGLLKSNWDGQLETFSLAE
ncbi:AlbA family DNA-binding domain-containing protein [Pedobacter flavus]|uniref:ATP-binding protein n=1 Tax=Pedobacter flavus TaxID=3113906 RepID=A0ABU7H3J3_9SPHI|nr:ATP-binding protein [Pedobacter sp. VNH31]MEE1885548.1 ATP-binding protein [Pedobacter sp. VNH31]